MAKKVEIKLSVGANEVLVEMQKNPEEVYTINKLKENGVSGASPSHMTKLVNEGLAEKLGTVKLVCACCGNSRSVLAHQLTEAGKVYGVPAKAEEEGEVAE